MERIAGMAVAVVVGVDRLGILGQLREGEAGAAAGSRVESPEDERHGSAHPDGEDVR